MTREEAIQALAESLQNMMKDIPSEEARRQAVQMLEESDKREQKEREKEERQRWKEAERLAKPPIDHEDAYWRHYNSNPHPPLTKEGKAWLRDNPWFEFKGKRWRREVHPMRSNSGKTVVAWNPSYHAEDGEVVAGDQAPKNRRNDPGRNWGLPE